MGAQSLGAGCGEECADGHTLAGRCAHRSLRCNAARCQMPHGPHSWEPQPGMVPVRCPGYGAVGPVLTARKIAAWVPAETTWTDVATGRTWARDPWGSVVQAAPEPAAPAGLRAWLTAERARAAASAAAARSPEARAVLDGIAAAFGEVLEHLDRTASVDEELLAAYASCPGYEMSPSPCRCPCYGCKHHCGAHQPPEPGPAGGGEERRDCPDHGDPIECTCQARQGQASEERRQRYARTLAEAAGSKAFHEPGREWEHMRSVWLERARAAMAVADDEQADLTAQLADARTRAEQAEELLTIAHQTSNTAERARAAAEERARKAEAALERVEEIAHGLRLTDAMRILTALDGPAEPGTNRRDKDAELRAATEQIERLTTLVRDFLDPDPCHYDHHGYCQAHAAGFGGEPRNCPHARARDILAALDTDRTQP